MSILLPLYIYPQLGAWDPLYTAITANPTLNFTVILNPNNGPGNTSLPDSRYTTEIPKFRAFPNVRTLGYVRTNYTKRDIEEVVQDVKTYAGWPIEANNTAMSVDGIFLDETPNLFDEGNYTYLKRASNVVREESAFKDRFVVHNPGNIPLSLLHAPGGEHLSYMDLSNLTVIFEQTFDAWLDRTSYNGLKTLTVDRNSVGVIVHSIPYVAPSVMSWIVKQLNGVSGHLFLVGYDATMNHYNRFSPLFTDFVAALTSAQDGGSMD